MARFVIDENISPDVAALYVYTLFSNRQNQDFLDFGIGLIEVIWW